MREVRSHLERLQTKLINPEVQKRAGWRRRGIVAVAEQNPRLTWPECELVRQLGNKLCGLHKDAPND